MRGAFIFARQKRREEKRREEKRIKSGWERGALGDRCGVVSSLGGVFCR